MNRFDYSPLKVAELNPGLIAAALVRGRCLVVYVNDLGTFAAAVVKRGEDPEDVPFLRETEDFTIEHAVTRLAYKVLHRQIVDWTGPALDALQALQALKDAEGGAA